MLRGLHDTRVPMLLAGLGYWVIGLPLALFLGFTMHFGGAGIWAALATPHRARPRRLRPSGSAACRMAAIRPRKAGAANPAYRPVRLFAPGFVPATRPEAAWAAPGDRNTRHTREASHPRNPNGR